MNHLPLTPDQYPLVTHDKIRYADTDRQGHVNNAVFATFCETGRVEILYNEDNPVMDSAGEFVIASLHLDFRAEIQWPGEITIGTGIRKLGNSSIRMVQVLYQGDRCVAEATTSIVQISRATRKALPLSQEGRGRLEKLLIPGED